MSRTQLLPQSLLVLAYHESCQTSSSPGVLLWDLRHFHKPRPGRFVFSIVNSYCQRVNLPRLSTDWVKVEKINGCTLP